MRGKVVYDEQAYLKAFLIPRNENVSTFSPREQPILIHHSFSFLDRLPSDVPSDEWEITPSASGSEKVILIRGQTDRKRLAAIKIYQDQFSRHFRQELGTLRDLKGKNNRENNRFNAIFVNCRSEGCRSVDRARRCLKQFGTARCGPT